MKIQKLTIHNIASLENVTLDFTAKPLVDSDVFLISGKTGSGKSTILDAICLALYNGTPRLVNNKIQGNIDDNGAEISVDSTKNLLRTGTCEGFVELHVEGTNGFPYRLRWEVTRARKKVNGNIRSTWCLENLKTGQMLVKQAEIREEVKLITGLASFEQFCRTCMLAQGEFTKFLNSKDDEKAEILEKITGADQYAKIGAKIYALFKEKKENLQHLEERVGDIAVLSDEERELRNEQVKELEKTKNETIEQRDSCNEKIIFLESLAELEKKVTDAGNDLRTAQVAAQTESFQEDQSLVVSYKETAEARRSLTIEQEKESQADKASKDIDQFSKQYLGLLEGELWLKQKIERLGKEHDAAKKEIESFQATVPVLEKRQTVEEKLNSIDKASAVTVQRAEEKQKSKSRLNEELIPQQKEDEACLDKASDELKKKEALLKTAKEDLAAADLPSLREQMSRTQAQLGNLNVAKAKMEALDRVRLNRQEEETAIQEEEKKLAELDSLAKEAVKTKAEKEKAYQRAFDLFEKVKDAEDSRIVAIRSSLSIGDVCPVCRQKITAALPTDNEISKVVLPVKVACEQAKKEYDEAQDKANKSVSLYETTADALRKRKEKFEQDKSVEQQEEFVSKVLEECGYEHPETLTLDLLSKEIETLNRTLEGMKERGKAGLALEEKAKNADAEERAAAAKFQKAKDALNTTKNDIAIVQGDIQRLEALLKEAEKTIREATEELEKTLSGSPWESTWKQDRNAFRKSLKEQNEKYEAAVSNENKLLDSLKDFNAQLTSIQDALKEIIKAAPEWNKFQAEKAVEHRDMGKVSNELRNSLIVAKEVLRKALEEGKAAQQKVDDFLAAHPTYNREKLAALSTHSAEEIDNKDKHNQQIQEAVRDASTRLKTHQDNLKLHQEKSPQLTEEDTVEALNGQKSVLDGNVQAIDREVGQIQNELKTDSEKRSSKAELLKQVEAAQMEANRWERLNSLLGSSDGATFRKIAQTFVLGSLTHAANGYMKMLTDRYTLKVHPGTFIIELEDAYQGYATRPASLISGGESFLVSLSLALALSDIGNAMSVDTLFIDEGFGTLSGEPIQRAVDMLKSLRKKMGRHVCIISHIEELQEKIPVKIMVRQEGHNATSTVDVVS